MMMMMMMMMIIIIMIIIIISKSSTSDPDSNIIYGSDSKGTITVYQDLTCTQYKYTDAKICNYWHMFNCRKRFKLQVRPPSLILLINISKDR